VGGQRGHTVDESDRLRPSFGSGPAPNFFSAGSGFHTQEQFIEILRYAHARHIEVIPEFDFPGHARAAIKSLAARSARLRQAGDAEAAASCLLTDPQDQSKYESVQLWRDNVADVGLGSTYRVVETIFDEVIDLYRRAGAPLSAIHIGGDEVPMGVWQQSPACQALLRAGAVKDLERRTLHAYFVNRAVELLNRRNLRTGCWEECVLTEDYHEGKPLKRPRPELVNQNVTAYVWNNVWGWGQEDVAYQLANAGYDVVLSNATNLYFDLAYDKDPNEPGYYWAGFVDERKPFEFIPLDFYKNAHTDALGNRIDPAVYEHSSRLTKAGARHILGLQGQLWSETLSTGDRLEYAAFPKVIALAERAWAVDPGWATIEDPTARRDQLDADWQRFANRLGRRELPRLDYLAGGVHYRIPPPGAAVIDGRVHANVAYPGLAIRFTEDGGAPAMHSRVYDAPFKPSGAVKFKAFSSRGRSSRTTVIQP
jgi:hexosaminidase